MLATAEKDLRLCNIISDQFALAASIVLAILIRFYLPGWRACRRKLCCILAACCAMWRSWPCGTGACRARATTTLATIAIAG